MCVRGCEGARRGSPADVGVGGGGGGAQSAEDDAAGWLDVARAVRRISLHPVAARAGDGGRRRRHSRRRSPPREARRGAESTDSARLSPVSGSEPLSAGARGSPRDAFDLRDLFASSGDVPVSVPSGGLPPLAGAAAQLWGEGARPASGRSTAVRARGARARRACASRAPPPPHTHTLGRCRAGVVVVTQRVAALPAAALARGAAR